MGPLSKKDGPHKNFDSELALFSAELHITVLPITVLPCSSVSFKSATSSVCLLFELTYFQLYTSSFILPSYYVSFVYEITPD